MANSAYATVVGTPDSFMSLTPTTSLHADADRSAPSTEFGDVDTASRQELWKRLASVVGMDVMNMRLSLPIWVFEPTTALTRMVEMFEYADLLDRAATCEDPALRDCLVIAFIISAFSHTERVRKPFNPLLGETYEYQNPVNGMKFYSEQVSHHPPVSVSRSQGNGWVAGEVVDIEATFHGNSIEINNIGSRYIHFTTTGDRYTWNLPKALVSNLFVGGAFVDHFGDIVIRNETSGTVANLNLSQCGWFSANRYMVTGELLDSAGNQTFKFKGAWNKYLDCDRVNKSKGEGCNRLWMAGSRMLPEDQGGGLTGTLAKCTKFTKKTLDITPEQAKELPPSDSRFRPDRAALEKGDSTHAAAEKLRVEQLQRDRIAEQKKSGKGEKSARFFKRVSEDAQKWEPIGNYWTETRALTDEQRQDMTLW